MVLELLLAAVVGALLAVGVGRLRERRLHSRGRLTFGFGDDKRSPLLDGGLLSSGNSSSTSWTMPRGALVARLSMLEQQNVELIARCQAYERQAMALAAQLEAARAEAEAARVSVRSRRPSMGGSISGEESVHRSTGATESLSHASPAGDVCESGGSFSSSSATQIETDRLLQSAASGGGGGDGMSVQVDNRRDDKATLVRVIVSNRVGLLAEMSAVLAGLGLSVITAAVATDEETGRATNDFYVQEHGRKVFGRSRLATIETRIQQWGRSGWLREGMQRLIDKALVGAHTDRVTPPSPLVNRPRTGGLSSSEPGLFKAPSLGSMLSWGATAASGAPPPPAGAAAAAAGLEPSLLKALTNALRGGALPFGALHATLAADLAASALGCMSVCRLPAGASLKANHGEWLILIESGDATVLTEGAGNTEAAPRPKDATQPVQRQPTRAMTLRADALAANGLAGVAPDLGGGVGLGVGAVLGGPGEPPPACDVVGTHRTSLPPCTVLWEVLVLPSDAAAASRSPSPPGSCASWASHASHARDAAARWLELTSRSGATVRVLHRTELRQLLVSTRERSARQHFRLLHELPVLAALPPSALLTLCRRATDIELPPNTTVLPVASRDASFSADPVAALLDDTTFAIVLAGELIVSLDPNVQEDEAVATRGSASALPSLPLFRLGVRDSLGEAGALHGAAPPPGVTFTTGAAGARLLCWPRDSSLSETLSRLPDLLVGSWRSRSYLGFLVEAPTLTRRLFEIGAFRRISASEIEQIGRRNAKGAPRASVCVVTRGTVLEHLPVQVKLTPIDASPDISRRAVPAPPDCPDALCLDGSVHPHGLTSWRRAARRFELSVRVHSRHRLLADLTSIIHDLGLEVHSARIATEASDAGVELANDVFAVTPRGAAAALDTESLVARITSQLSEVLTIHPLRPGDASISGTDGHRLRVPPHADEPPTALQLDLAAAAAALASETCMPRGCLPEDIGKHGLGALFRTLLSARHGHLATYLSAPHDATSGGKSTEWLLALSELCVYLQREAAGQGEEGMRMEDLVSELTLGEGASGTVRLARHRFSGRIYAVKIFDKARLAKGQNGRALLRYIEREREVLQLLSTKVRGDRASAHMVRYVCSGQDGPTLRLVMPACLGGELWNVLAEFGAMSEAEARFYAGCLVLALQTLHGIGVVYRDLKPENVLLSHTGWPVIADFGLATIGALEERPLYSMCGTPEFMAPEVVRSLGYGASADWWSLGVLICQCLTLATPFADPQGRAQMTFSNIVRGRVTAERSQHYRLVCSPHAVALLDALLQPEPAKRLGDARRDAGRIRIHPFFWGLDWQALESRRLAPPHADFCALTAQKLLASQHQPPAPDAPAPELTQEQQQLFAHW